MDERHLPGHADERAEIPELHHLYGSRRQPSWPLLFQQSVDTYQAYNNYPTDGTTGKSLYGFNSYGATTGDRRSEAAKVSFDRPYAGEATATSYPSGRVNFVRWIERSGYDVSYSTNLDTHT